MKAVVVVKFAVTWLFTPVLMTLYPGHRSPEVVWELTLKPPVLVAGSAVPESFQRLLFLRTHQRLSVGLTAWHMTSPCEGAVSWVKYAPGPIWMPPSS